MQVTRHYFISDDLDELEQIETNLESHGVDSHQIHVLSLDDTEVAQRVNLNDVTSLMKKDVVRSGQLGLSVGVAGAIAILLLAYWLGWTSTAAGWLPFVFLAVVVLGFCTWEGGFIGIQRPNQNFQRFERALKAGKHVFFVDVRQDQQHLIDNIITQHSRLELAGSEKGTPSWLLVGQKRVPHFLTETLP